jgi:5-(carboxyamino)imidazole ribonucleotide synthase
LGGCSRVAAAQLGYRTHVYAPEQSGPAADTCAQWTQAPMRTANGCGDFADAVDVLTYEFENIDSGAIETLSHHGLVAAQCRGARIAQDRLKEKSFVADLGGAHRALRRREQPRRSRRRQLTISAPPLSSRPTAFGYDGKGQVRLTGAPAEAEAAWEASAPSPAILEGFVTFEMEFSVILARGATAPSASGTAPGTCMSMASSPPPPCPRLR